MLKYIVLTFRIRKQNQNIISFHSKVILILVLVILFEKSKKSANVSKKLLTSSNFYYNQSTPFMVEILCAKFHYHSYTQSKVIEPGKKHPPGLSLSKKPGYNRVRALEFLFHPRFMKISIHRICLKFAVLDLK